MTGQKLGFPDSGTCDWPIEIIETIEPMQKVQENSCQSCKKSDNIWGKYTSRAISPIYTGIIASHLIKLWCSGQIQEEEMWDHSIGWIG